MTLRRRFFPTTPAQTLPGNTVELELQLRRQPVGVAPVAAAPTGVACTGWLAPWLCAAPHEALVVEPLPDGRTAITGTYFDDDLGTDFGGLEASVWDGTPAALDVLGRARPVPSEGFVCVDLQINTTGYTPFPGRHFTALVPGGEWLVAWDAPSVGDPLVSASGHRAIVVGGTLVVAAADTDTGTNAIEVLTANALTGGTVVKQLFFRARRIAT